MEVGGRAADELVKDSMQITETAVKLAGSGLKNVAALLLALAKDNYKVVGQTSARRLARDTTPAAVIHLKKEDIPQFRKLAKEYGILYFIAQKKGNESNLVNVVSNQNYVAKLNAAMEALHYPTPEKETVGPKKVAPRVQQEKCSPERGSGSTPSERTQTSDKPSVKGRLAALEAASRSMKPQLQREHNKTR